MSRWPISFTQRIFVSTRLRRWYPPHRRQMARPRSFDACSASYRATAPAGTVFHGWGVLAGQNDSICAAISDGIVAIVGIVGTVCRSAAGLLAVRYLAETVRRAQCIANVASGDLGSPDFQCFLIDPKVDLAPGPPFGAPCLRACCSPSPSALPPVLSINRCSGPLEPR